MFLKSGGIIPRSPKLMNLHNQDIEKLDLLIEPSEKSEFTVYEDDGKSNDYKKGLSLETKFNVNPSKKMEFQLMLNALVNTRQKLKVLCCQYVVLK